MASTTLSERAQLVEAALLSPDCPFNTLVPVPVKQAAALQIAAAIDAAGPDLSLDGATIEAAMIALPPDLGAPFQGVIRRAIANFAAASTKIILQRRGTLRREDTERRTYAEQQGQEAHQTCCTGVRAVMDLAERGRQLAIRFAERPEDGVKDLRRMAVALEEAVRAFDKALEG